MQGGAWAVSGRDKIEVHTGARPRLSHTFIYVNDCSITRSIAGSGPPSHKPLRVKRRIARTIPAHHQPIAVMPEFIDP